MDRNGRKRRITMQCFEKVGFRLDSSFTSNTAELRGGSAAGRFPNDIVHCAGVASTTATQPRC